METSTTRFLAYVLRYLISIVMMVSAITSVSDAHAMLRVMAFNPLTTVRNHEVCIYARHEFNPRSQYQNEALNGKEPIVCKLVIYAETNSKKPKGSLKFVNKEVIKTFTLDVLTRSCVTFPELKPKKLKITSYA